MDLRGWSEIRRESMADGIPPLEGKVCDGTLVSGRYASIWVVPQKFSRLLSHDTVMYHEDESLFCLT